MRRRRIRGAIVILLPLILGGCGDSVNRSGGEPKGAKELRLGAVLPTFGHPFFVAQKEGLERAARELGVVLDVRDGKDDDLKQIAQVETLINQGVDAIVLCPRDQDALVRAVKSANGARIPVIALNRQVSAGSVVTYVGADDVEAGRQQGRALVAALGSAGGKIIYLQGTQGSSPQRARAEGLNEVLKDHPEIVIADSRFADFQADAAKQIMTALARRFKPGELRAIVAQSDEMAIPAAELARAEGWKDVIVIGLDGTRQAFAAVESGLMHATVVQDAAEQGAIAVKAAVDHLRGASVPKRLITDLPIATRSNLAGMRPSY